jgi:hypothetical protein
MAPTKAILGGLAGIASGLSAISFARMIKGANDSIDAMGEVAGRLGIAAGELQTYRIAAKFAGTESATLDKSLGLLARRLGDIRAGLDTGSKNTGLLKSLGLSAEDIQGGSLDQVFEKVVSGLSRIEDPATRSASAGCFFFFGGISPRSTASCTLTSRSRCSASKVRAVKSRSPFFVSASWQS